MSNEQFRQWYSVVRQPHRQMKVSGIANSPERSMTPLNSEQ